jgi:hypothetical protein
MLQDIPWGNQKPYIDRPDNGKMRKGQTNYLQDATPKTKD